MHGDRPLPPGKVLHGHVHPCLRLGGQVTAPCYLVSPRRLILPAFSADARGVPVLNTPSWQRHRCCVPVADAVLDLGEVRTLRRALALSDSSFRARVANAKR